MNGPRPDVLTVASSGVGLEPVFQQVVSLADASVVGFEALARWPGLGNPDPQAVFAHAGATGRLDELDQACIDNAIDGALALDLSPGTLLMVNCEPTSAYVLRSQDRGLACGQAGLRVMFELTERNLLEHPRALLRKVAALRAEGFAVALDDVGAHPDSLALLDIVCPDVIKLDLHLVRSHPSDDQTRTLAAVLAHQERTGSVLLAEGIESEAHVEQALALGASLGQGYLFGRPAPTNPPPSVPWSPPPMKHPIQPDFRSPFASIERGAAVRTARKATLIPFSRHIEMQALHAADPPMVLTAMQVAANFTGSTRDRYREIGGVSPLAAVFGQGLSGDLAPGLRGVDIDADDPLCAEWIVVILGPHHAAALVARERFDAGPPVADGDRRFDLVITYDRVCVTVVARNLLERIR